MENASINQSNNLKPKTHILLVGVVLVILNTGLSSGFIADSGDSQQIITLLIAIGFNVLTVFWCMYDSRERNEQLGRYFTLSVVLFGVFALFYYFFKTRGFTSGLVAIGNFLVVFFGTILLSSIVFNLLNAVFNSAAQ